ncbi:MAG: patatin-like phospholipase family protein [Pseudomonadales bacterium]|nr:patatin-like phospholipase family protein [Pseudomonadales bacterium]
MSLFTLQAGSRAYRKIQRDGLRAGDVGAVFGASGAAKWLAISGLDKAIFGRWLAASEQQILTFGTSVGAFKLAAAAQHNPVAALDRLAVAYIEQQYPDGLTREAIAQQLDLILDKTIPDAARHEILGNPRYLFSCAATACPGLLGSEQAPLQWLGMAGTALRELSPQRLQLRANLRRIIFCSEQARVLMQPQAGNFVALSEASLKPAIIASGSLPLYMHGVQGLHPHTLRDGGLLDYHPVPSNLLAAQQGLVLYPHFFPHLVERWFDKFYPWRKVTADRLEDVVLISPSQAFCDSLELGRVPDRSDFKRYYNRDAERMRLWREVTVRSDEMGEQFLDAVQSGKIVSLLEPLPRQL